MQTNINVQELTVEAALTGKREHVYHAAMLDPHTAAELDLDQIWNLVDELDCRPRRLDPAAELIPYLRGGWRRPLRASQGFHIFGDVLGGMFAERRPR